MGRTGIFSGYSSDLKCSCTSAGGPEATVVDAKGAAPLASTVLVDETNAVHAAWGFAPVSIAVVIGTAGDGLAVPVAAIVISVAIAVPTIMIAVVIPIPVVVAIAAGIATTEATPAYPNRRNASVPVLAGIVGKA